MSLRSHIVKGGLFAVIAYVGGWICVTGLQKENDSAIFIGAVFVALALWAGYNLYSREIEYWENRVFDSPTRARALF